MSIQKLQDLFRDQKVTDVAIIDDVFDVPAPEHLSRERFESFVREYESNVALRESIGVLQSGARISRPLPSFEDLRVGDLEPIWRCYWMSCLEMLPLFDGHTLCLKQLFQEHTDDVVGDLDSVLNIVRLFQDDLGVSVAVYGNEDQDLDKIAHTQIVIVDYFLIRDSSMEAAYKRVSEAITGVVNKARQDGSPIPLFLLVSARPSDVDSERLRKECGLMKSRFEFFRKSNLRCLEVENIFRIYALVGAFHGMEMVEKLFRDWRRGAEEAIDFVHREMFSLNFADLVRLSRFRLAHEGVSISNYLRWFMIEYLSSVIDKKLDEDLWSNANSPKFLGLVGESTGTLDGSVVSGEIPSDVMFNAYSNIMFDDRPSDRYLLLPSTDLMEGDLFVCSQPSVVSGYEGARVLLVITPSCDLAQREQEKVPSARNVLLLPGVLRGIPSGGTERENDFSRDVMIRIGEVPHRQVFRIEWQFIEPVTRAWQEVEVEGVELGFERLGRIQKLYFHRIRDDFMNRLTRIGTEVPPPWPVSRGGIVQVKLEKRGQKLGYRTVMSFLADSLMLWEISSARDTKGKSERMYQVSRLFISNLMDKLEKAASKKGADPELVKAAREAAMQLRELDMWISLLTAKKWGYRGRSNEIYFAKTKRRSKFVEDASLRARICIFPLIDE